MNYKYNALVIILFFIAIISCKKQTHLVSEDYFLSGQLLKSRTVNFKNKVYPNETEWIEYYFTFINKGEKDVYFCSKDPYLIIGSSDGEIDSIPIFLGKTLFKPRERDTIRISAIYPAFDSSSIKLHLINPKHAMITCLENTKNPDLRRDNFYQDKIIISKSSDFTFEIE